MAKTEIELSGFSEELALLDSGVPQTVEQALVMAGEEPVLDSLRELSTTDKVKLVALRLQSFVGDRIVRHMVSIENATTVTSEVNLETGQFQNPEFRPARRDAMHVAYAVWLPHPTAPDVWVAQRMRDIEVHETSRPISEWFIALSGQIAIDSEQTEGRRIIKEPFAYPEFFKG